MIQPGEPQFLLDVVFVPFIEIVHQPQCRIAVTVLQRPDIPLDETFSPVLL